MKKTFLACVSMLTMLAVGLSACGTNTTREKTIDSTGEGTLQTTDKTEVNADTLEPAIAESSQYAWESYANELVTLDWYVNYSWFVTKWGGNVVSDRIKEETGVNINFISPMGNEDEKMKALISSNALPDLITLGWWDTQLSDMIDKDMVYALNELADQYDPYFYEVTDPDVVEWYTNSDGNIYCYPNSAYTPKDLEEHDNIGSNQTFLVRKDIYEAIGSPDMTTPEGFCDAIRKAVEMFPTVDGEPLIPIGAHEFDDRGNVSFDSYLQNFLAVPFEEDGKIYDRFTDPEYTRWLKVFRQLNEEGYLAGDIFVDTRTQMSEKLEQGRYFCMIYQRTDLADQEKLLYDKNPEKIYIAVDGPRNSRGDNPTLAATGINGWTVTFISKNCKHPDRAIAFLDYMMSERGQKYISIGIEGVTFDLVDGQVVYREDVKNLLNTNRLKYDKKYGADDTYWMLQDNVMQLEWRPVVDEPLRQLEEWTYPYTQYLGHYDFLFTGNSKVVDMYNKCQKLWAETLPRLLLAESEEDFDELLASYIERRDALGFEYVLEEETRQMLEHKRKLGIE